MSGNLWEDDFDEKEYNRQQKKDIIIATCIILLVFIFGVMVIYFYL